MTRGPFEHESAVDAWLGRFPPAATTDDLIDLFRRANEVVWRRAKLRVGEITLLAVADRVLTNARDRFPERAACLQVVAEGFHLDGLRVDNPGVDLNGCRDVLRFVLIDYLRILGRLTAEVLTSALLSELEKLTPMRDGHR